MNQKEIMKPKEAAEYLGFALRTLMTKYRSGEIRGYRIGYKTVKFKKKDLDDYLEIAQVEFLKKSK